MLFFFLFVLHRVFEMFGLWNSHYIIINKTHYFRGIETFPKCTKCVLFTEQENILQATFMLFS